ncbi:MAG: 3-deoxy-D-manno-octulosonic acid transferase [Deltaproteobacteria bacterium]|nr:3-deoxy-D-manno-octulosonic acid transferase [Deltaproteobacteria bacterium]
MKYVLYEILANISFAALTPYFILKMLTVRKYRDGIPERFGFIQDEKLRRLEPGPVIWIHAVSVGETKAVIPLLRLIKESHPEAKILFSTITKTGNDVAKKECAGLMDSLIYFPLDLSWAVGRVIRQTRPGLFIVVEKEVWPNTYRGLHAEAVPIIVVNGTISDKSFRRFLRLGFFFRPIFGMISSYCARTEEDMRRAIASGVEKDRALCPGNVKFDLNPPPFNGNLPHALKTTLGISEGDVVFAAGSTHRGEEEIIIDAYKRLAREFGNLKLVLAPRHPERFNEAENLFKKAGIPYARRTSGDPPANAVLLDTIGELMAVYSISDIAFVGGSIVQGIGGHNLLEPAFFSKPVIYGPHLTAYLAMAELLESHGAGIRVKDGQGLYTELKKLLNDSALRRKKGEAAKKVVEANRGAARKTLKVIEGFLAEDRRRPPLPGPSIAK